MSASQTAQVSRVPQNTKTAPPGQDQYQCLISLLRDGGGFPKRPPAVVIAPCHLPGLDLAQPASPPPPRLPSIRLVIQKAQAQKLILWVLAMPVAWKGH